MQSGLRYGFVASFVVVGCVVAGVEIDPSFGGAEAGEGGDAGDTGQGGSTSGKGGKGGSSGSDTGGQGGTSGGGKGGTSQGGTDSGGTDSGGTDSGGTDTGGSAGQGGAGAGGIGRGGTGGSGIPKGGAGAGGGVKGGTAGSGPLAGGTGGSAGGASCVGIKSGSPCAPDGAQCPNMICGLADTGRRTCNCMTTWSCTSCNFGSGRFATQPPGIAICGAGTADEVACSDASLVCGPQAGSEYCACYLDPADGLIWDCDAPPSTWGCTGSSVTLTISGGTMAHDHLPLPAADTLNMVTQIRAATNGVSLTLPMETDGHTHALPLTQAHLATLRGGGMLTGIVSSTFTGHNHTYAIQCGP